METIEKKFIIDENNKKIAVQIPIETFEKIEEVLENYALFQLIKENEGEEILEMREAKEYYKRLKKTQ
jgi:acetyl-CoA carboxylase beta subunit